MGAGNVLMNLKRNAPTTEAVNNDASTCAWRVVESSTFSHFAILVGLSSARPGRPRSPSADDNRPTCRSRRRPFGGRRIRARQAAVADPQSDPEARTESPPHGSHRRWSMCAPHPPDPSGPCRDCLEARNALPPSSSAEDSEIPPAVLADGTKEAGPAGAQPRRGGRRRGHETTESDVGLSTNRAADRLRLRYFHQQGCRAAHSRREVQAGAKLSWTVLAHGARSREGQSVESRLVSVRIGGLADTLGARGDGPLHASHRGLWRALRRRGRRRAVPNVQSSDARPHPADLRQLGP